MPIITEVYNNILHDPRLVAKWGFSCYLEDARLLFDTGGDGGVLLYNLEQLGICCTDIDTLVLSHDHWDHTGGLRDLLTKNPSMAVWILDQFSDATKTIIKTRTRPVVAKGWTEISAGVYTTGPLGDTTVEQSLVLTTGNGLLVVTGCAHPHIATILRVAGRHGEVRGAIGGFHTVSSEDIDSLMPLSYLSASHCTQELDEIRRRFGEKFVDGGAGKRHII
jgi:7,8-dihydropterin-6-yl-methyl-4-(beta-D-ribofuranosyl)aminobenzene 5'-phosphate synthase